MNIDSIRAYCLAFPQATEKLQWGDDLCFKIAGKIFAILGLDNPRLCFKCSPEVFSELIEREDIRPAPYVGRYKWVMLDRLDAVSDAELQDLIERSYTMVAAKAPKRARRGSQPAKKAKKMGYLFRRLAHGLLVLAGVSVLSFTFMALAPGDFLNEMRLDPGISRDMVAALRHRYGLDQPDGPRPGAGCEPRPADAERPAGFSEGERHVAGRRRGGVADRRGLQRSGRL